METRMERDDGLERVGEGAMGVCFLEARPPGTQVRKVFHSTTHLSKVRLRLALARVALVFDSRLARTYDVREVDRRLLLLRDWAPGESLAAILARRGGLPRGEALYVLREVALGLRALHRAHVAHGEVKPGHVIVGRAAVRLIDAGSPSGELAYAPPEARTGLPPTTRADLWQWGALAIETLCGVPLALGGRLPRETPDSLARVVHKCLQLDPRDRPFSVEPILGALVRAETEPPPLPTRPKTEAPTITLDEIPEVVSGLVLLEDGGPHLVAAPTFSTWASTPVLPLGNEDDPRIPVGLEAVWGPRWEAAEAAARRIGQAATLAWQSVARRTRRVGPQT